MMEHVKNVPIIAKLVIMVTIVSVVLPIPSVLNHQIVIVKPVITILEQIQFVLNVNHNVKPVKTEAVA